MTSKELSLDAMSATNNGVLLDLLSARRTEINSSFDRAILQQIQETLKRHEFTPAKWGVRILMQAGAVTNDLRRQALALSQLAIVEILEGHDSNAAGALKRCIEKCSASTEIELQKLKADSMRTLGNLQCTSLGNVSEGLGFLDQARSLYERLGDIASAADIKNQISDIQTNAQTSAPPVSPRELFASQEKLDSLRRQIEEAQTLLDRCNKELDGRQKAVLQLKSDTDRLTAEREQAQELAKQLSEQILLLQQKVHMLQTATRLPLWVVVINDDIANGRISDVSLQLLDRMRATMPEVTNPLLAEIRARNHLAPEGPFDLSVLTGETRLFAGIANSLLSEKADRLKSVEILLDAWETYLSQVNFSAL
jgi:hypothetical protein